MEDSIGSTVVIADYRERNSGIIEALRTADKVIVQIQTLESGDYLVDNRLLFERKTLSDFISAIKDGRIFRQGIRLASSSFKSVLILEGRYESILNTGMKREAIQGALITINLTFGIPIFRSIDPAESARLILYASRQVKSFTTDSIPRQSFRPKGKRAAQLHLLMGLPGVGPKRAQLLLSKFGSVEKALTASPDELIEVEGVGKKTVDTIRWIVSEPNNTYSPVHDTTFPI